MIRTSIVGAVCAALVLAGCSSDADDSPSGAVGSPDDSSTIIAEGTIDPGDIGNIDDPLCASAVDSVEASEELVATSEELNELMSDPDLLTGDDASTLNEWGDSILELTETTNAFYDEAVELTAGEDVNADFVTLQSFVELYSRAIGQAAADAATPQDFFETVGEMFSDEETLAVLEEGPAAAESVAAYMAERCDITR